MSLPVGVHSQHSTSQRAKCNCVSPLPVVDIRGTDCPLQFLIAIKRLTDQTNKVVRQYYKIAQIISHCMTSASAASMAAKERLFG